MLNSHMDMMCSDMAQVGLIGLVDERNDMDQGWTGKANGSWTYRRLYVSRQKPTGLDTYVDDELHLHLRHRLLEIRHPRFLLASLPILRHPNPHSGPVMHHSGMVSVATLHGVFAMSTTHSIMGWRPSNEGC